ncbi:MAG: complex I subunit 1/NuoH family protein [Candidatus Thorarchaeota archaeon]
MNGGLTMLQFDLFDWLGNLDIIGWLRGIPEWIYGVIMWIHSLIVGVFNWVWGVFVWGWALVLDNSFLLFKAILFPGTVFILFLIIFDVWFTRKVWARIQARRGPFHIGKYGGLQLFADAIKLVSKESIIPQGAKRWMFRVLPSLLLVVVLLPFVFVPWSESWVIADLSVSLVLVFAFLTAVPVLALLIGWVSGSKYTLIGGFRAASNQFAAEIPLVISSVGPALLAGSLSVLSISQAQAQVWYVFLLPINFVTFMVSAIATVGLVPFDAPVADSEVIFGWRTELTGIYFTMTYFAEFAKQVLYAALMVTFFFGGGYGVPTFPPVLNFFLKFLVMLFFFIIVTSSFYRIRQDQIVKYSWKYLMPLSVINVVVVLLALVYVPGLAGLLSLQGG